MGENSVREARSGCCYSLHAEMDAIKHLPPLKIKSHKRIIMLLVIRIDKLGHLKNSAPCFKCLEHINQVNQNTSYRIKTVCYSNENGDIVIKKLDELSNAETKHVSMRFRRNICNKNHK